mgnify:CR=1 FL=1
MGAAQVRPIYASSSRLRSWRGVEIQTATLQGEFSNQGTARAVFSSFRV